MEIIANMRKLIYTGSFDSVKNTRTSVYCSHSHESADRIAIHFRSNYTRKEFFFFLPRLAKAPPPHTHTLPCEVGYIHTYVHT